MVFFPPIPVIRKKHIIKKLTECKAFSKETAKTFVYAGIINPDGFKRITEMLVHRNIIVRTEDNKFYLTKYYHTY